MLTKILLSCFLLNCSFICASDTPAKQEVLKQIVQTEVTEVVDLYDECEPEFILKLDNGLSILCKWWVGIFYAGQPVGLRMTDDEIALSLITYDCKGVENGQFILLNTGGNSYKAY